MLGSCPCGAVTFETKRPPPVRFFCHCTICQSFYGPPYADITACWTWSLRLTGGADELRYERRAWFPASVKRGICRQCDNPVLGYLQLPMPGVTFVGTRNWKDAEALPEPVGHLHTQSSVEAVDDALPQVEGVMKSTLVASAWMMPRLLRGR